VADAAFPRLAYNSFYFAQYLANCYNQKLFLTQNVKNVWLLGPAGGAFSTHPDSLAGFMGAASWQRRETGRERERRNHLPYHQFLDLPLVGTFL